MGITDTVQRLFPTPDGEGSMRHRSGIVTAVNADGTLDVTLGTASVTVPALAGSVAAVGDTVHVAVWAGDLLALGRVRGSLRDSDWITDTMTTSISVGVGGVTLLKHKFVGGLVHVKGSIKLGTSGFNVGANATMNLPVTVETPLSPYFCYAGSANMYDSSVPANYELNIIANNLSTTQVSFATVASAIGARAGVGTGTPVTWAANDVLSFHFIATPA